MAKQDREYYCSYCQQSKAERFFKKDYRRKDASLPLCRICANNRAQAAFDQTGSMEVGFWTVAMIEGLPAIRKAINLSLHKHQADFKHDKPDWVNIYMDSLKELGVLGEVWNSDVDLSSYIQIADRITNAPKEQVDYGALGKIWGNFIDENGAVDKAQYDFLEGRFEEYTTDVPNITTAMANQYRNLCKAEWQKRKADESGDIADIQKAQKLVDDLLKSLRLDNFNSNVSDMDRFIDRLAWKIENTEPAEEEDEEKYKDVAGYEKNFSEIMRSMQNLIFGTRDYPEVPEDER